MESIKSYHFFSERQKLWQITFKLIDRNDTNIFAKTCCRIFIPFCWLDIKMRRTDKKQLQFCTCGGNDIVILTSWNYETRENFRLFLNFSDEAGLFRSIKPIKHFHDLTQQNFHCTLSIKKNSPLKRKWQINPTLNAQSSVINVMNTLFLMASTWCNRLMRSSRTYGKINNTRLNDFWVFYSAQKFSTIKINQLYRVYRHLISQDVFTINSWLSYWNESKISQKHGVC